MSPGERTDVLPSWLRDGRYDVAASDRAAGLYVYKTGWRRWEWFVHAPKGRNRGWLGWAPNLKQAWHNGFILAANPDGVSWIDDVTGFPG